MSQSPKTFEDFKKEMKTHWEEEIIAPSSLLGKSANFFIKHIQDYSINCLFIELLDLQIHLSEKHKNFAFIFPIQEENNFAIFRRPEEAKINSINKSKFLECVNSLVDQDSTKEKLNTFLKDHPEFDYYFWNVTFPNIFLGFISEEYCTKAASFLNYFQNDKEIFSTGVSSFITHNYYFQDSFMKSFFIYSQNSDINFEKSIQNSLEKAVQKLTIQQLNALEILIDKYPEEAMKTFLDKIIIGSIKLWKYSPLFSPSQINGDGEHDLLNYIDTQFKKDANHEENLKNLLNPVFKAVKSKITINKIEIKRIIFNVTHKFALTFLDILILQKVADFKLYTAQMGPLFDKFNDNYLFKKAFYYIIVDKTEGQPEDMRNEVKIPDKIKFDIAYVNQWSKFKEDKEKHNKNPLEVFYKEEELNKLLKKDPQLALTGIASSYYEWLSYRKTKDMLKKESRALIPLKAILESQKSYMEIISTYYSFTFPISHDDFANNLKGLFRDVMRNVILKYVKKKFARSNQYTMSIKANYATLRQKTEANKKKETKETTKEIAKINDNIDKLKSSRKTTLEQIVTDFNERLTNEFSQNFDTYFNNKNGAENLYTFTVDMLTYLYRNYMDPTSVASLTNYRPSFDKYIEFMRYLSRAYLISSYNDAKVNIVKSTSPIDVTDYEMITNDSFLPYASSGIFNYISAFVESLESSEKDSKIPIGQIFAVVPVINKFLKQFVDSQSTAAFMLVNNIPEEKDLAKLIFGYTFKFYTIKKKDDADESSTDDYEKTTTNFVNFLLTALNELCTFKDRFPYFQELNNEFEFLKENLPI